MYFTDVSKVKEVFDEFYSGIVKILPVKNILHQLVPAKVLTPDDIEEIDSLRKSEDKSSYVLAIIDKSLKADITLSFYTLLDIMEKYGGDVGVLAKKIQRDLMMRNQGNVQHTLAHASVPIYVLQARVHTYIYVHTSVLTWVRTYVSTGTSIGIYVEFCLLACNMHTCDTYVRTCIRIIMYLLQIISIQRISIHVIKRYVI